MQPNSTTPPYQLLDPLSDEQHQALKADIAKRGILVPIEVDEAGNILDGHHRVRAWQELRAEGITVPQYNRIVRVGMSEPEKRNHVRVLNLIRRHLTSEQMREQQIAMLADGARPEWVAEATDVSVRTVYNLRREIPTLQNCKVEGKDGKARPTRYAPRQHKSGFARNEREQAKVTEALKNTGEKAQTKTITPSEAREASNHPPEATSTQPSTTVAIPGLRLGRFQEALADVPDASVDLIFTDPPYAKAFLAQWSDLSALAARVLKPGGMFVAYSGQTYLPEVMARLSEHLQYWWLGAIWHGGSSGMVLADQPVRKIVNVWKPLLFYVRAGFVQGAALRDGVEGQGAEKDAHGWQQSVAEAEFYIRHLCPEGGLVVDPCLGGGTTAVAATRLSRLFIGAEENENAYHRAIERIGHEREART